VSVVLREFDGFKDWEWFTRHNPIKRVQDTSGITAVDAESGEILAIVVCDTWYSDSVNLHIVVTDNRIVRYGFMEAIFNYVFNNNKHENIKIAYGFIPTNNAKARKLIKNVGFTEVYTLSGGDGGVGFHILTLDKKDCKFLKGNKHG